MDASFLDPNKRSVLLALQRDEMTGAEIYRNLAATAHNGHNRRVLEKISAEELHHALVWKRFTGQEIGPDPFRVACFRLIAKVLGITFSVRLMERMEKQAQDAYRRVEDIFPEAAAILLNEEAHEQELIGLIDEERLRYIGSVVLGLNDALVEFTGSLAGFTFALQDTGIIAVAGLIMGIAASLSMAASEYLSKRSGEEDGRIDPKKASVYTGLAYGSTVILLVLPFLVFDNPFVALPLTLTAAVIIILVFSCYLSIVKDLPLWQRFIEMAALSLGIAAVSFLIGMVIRIFLGIDA